jgi:hypothetical protein
VDPRGAVDHGWEEKAAGEEEETHRDWSFDACEWRERCCEGLVGIERGRYGLRREHRDELSIAVSQALDIHC